MKKILKKMAFTSLLMLFTSVPFYVNASNNVVTGYIDGVFESNAGSYYIRGWACEKGLSESIYIHLYFGGRAGRGKLYKSYLANQASSSTISKICSSGNKAHRFKIPVNTDMLSKHQGESIFIHGISKTNKMNDLLGHSGEFQLPLINESQNIKTPYNFPLTKQGLSSRNYALNLKSQKRFNVYKNEINMGMQKFNYFWKGFENSPKLSSSNPINCPKGYVLFPKNGYEKLKLEINKYHCYQKSSIDTFQKYFKKSYDNGLMPAVVLWGSPEKYRDPDCEGFYFSLKSKYLKDGCYPAQKHYIDYEDWITFTAYTYGKYIDHYIFWNEVSSTNWADISSKQYPKSLLKKDPTKFKNRMVQVHSTLFKKTLEKVNQFDKSCRSKGCKNLVYVSLDHAALNYKNGLKYIGKRFILDDIWNKIGLNYPWAIARHAYGFKNIKTIDNLISYQKQKIRDRKGKKVNPLNFPQSFIFLSEQNTGRIDIPFKSKFICETQNYSINTPEVISQTHNHFQRTVNQYRINYESEKLEAHSMLPAGAGSNLEYRNKYEVFQAYKSTSKLNWGENNNHFCCKKYALGCLKPNRNVKLHIDKRNRSLIAGWTFDPDKHQKSLVVYFVLNGKRIGKTIANFPRIGVNRNYKASGNHGFNWLVPNKYKSQFSKIKVFVNDASSTYFVQK